MEMLKNVRRVDFSLAGSFADMILLSSLRTGGKSHFDGLFVLTNPGQLQFTSTEILSALVSSQERKSSLSGIEPPVVVPTINPQMTAAKLSLLPTGVTFSMRLSEVCRIFNWSMDIGKQFCISYLKIFYLVVCITIVDDFCWSNT